ncbi:hypothetical protein FRB94_007540 [Tulasnella sp. JGI-2019a]|nr:hypothetical protein FRB94_007540 [Tulasnella sp. JGI-2019a]
MAPGSSDPGDCSGRPGRREPSPSDREKKISYYRTWNARQRQRRYVSYMLREPNKIDLGFRGRGLVRERTLLGLPA